MHSFKYWLIHSQNSCIWFCFHVTYFPVSLSPYLSLFIWHPLALHSLCIIYIYIHKTSIYIHFSTHSSYSASLPINILSYHISINSHGTAIQVLWHSRPVKALTADIKPPLLVGNPVETQVKDETVVKPTRGRVEVVTEICFFIYICM